MVGLAGENLAGAAGVGRIEFSDVETDDLGVRFLDEVPGAPSVGGEEVPAVGAVAGKMIWIIVAAAPFDERIVCGLSFDSIIDGLRRELGKMSEAGRPAERNFTAVRIDPVVRMMEEVTLEPLDVVAVGADEADGAARIGPIDFFLDRKCGEGVDC